MAAQLYGDKIDNCHISDCKITSNDSIDYSGGIAGNCYAAVSNCSATEIEYTGYLVKGGGIVGSCTSVYSCKASGNTIDASGTFGCIVGYSAGWGQDSITGCVAENNTVTAYNCGGIAGEIIDVTVDNCLSRSNTFSAMNNKYECNLGGLAGISKCVVRSSLSLNNTFKMPYNSSSTAASQVAKNKGTTIFTASCGNNFDGVDTRNVSNNDGDTLTEAELKTALIVAEKLKLNREIWTLTDGEFPVIILNW